MTEWRDNHGRVVTEAVRHPDYERGIARVRVIKQCRRCRGTRYPRGNVCPTCQGTGQRVEFRMVFEQHAKMRFDARVARLRCLHQNRTAGEVLQRMARFEEDFAPTLALLRDNPAIPRFSSWLREAESDRYISDSRLAEIREAWRVHEEALRAAREAEREADESHYIGTAGERITIEGTVRRAAFGRVVLHTIPSTPGGRRCVVHYAGDARAMYNLRIGDRVRLNGMVRRHFNTMFYDRAGNLQRRIMCQATRIQRPTQVTVLERRAND